MEGNVADLLLRPDELPFVLRLRPQAAHAIENQGAKAFHAIRVEYKKGYPEGPADGYAE